MTITKRAPKGGALGANGEWYEGGKFINTVAENDKRHGSVPKRPRKVQVEPYVWVIVEDGRKPLFSIVGNEAQWDRQNPGKIKPFPPYLEFIGKPVAEVQVLCDRWNAGERWL